METPVIWDAIALIMTSFNEEPDKGMCKKVFM